MRNQINIVASLKFTRLEEVTNYQENFNGTALVESANWNTLPLHEGSVRMSVEDRKNASGVLYSVEITGRLKELIQVNAKGILLVKMCEGDEYIIGTPDLPAAVNLTTSLTQKSFRISHQNTVFPLKMAV